MDEMRRLERLRGLEMETMAEFKSH